MGEMKLITGKLGDWMAGKTVSESDKIAHCFDVIESARSGSDCFTLEAVGKSACHLSYRILDGTMQDTTEPLAFSAIQWAKDHARTTGRETAMHQARWVGSITMALAYITILRRGGKELGAALCKEIINDASVRALPQNAINIMRACVLRAAWACSNGAKTIAINALDDCDRIFRLGASLFPFDKGVMRGDELIRMATLAKLSIGIRNQCVASPVPPVFPWQQLATIDTQEPFKSAFIAMSPKDQTK